MSRCRIAGCRAAVAWSGNCLGHLCEDEFRSALLQWAHEGEEIDGRRATVSADRLNRLFKELVHQGPIRNRIRLDEIRVDGNVKLRDVTLEGSVDLRGADIDGRLELRRVRGLPRLRLGFPASRRTSMHALSVNDIDAPDENWSILETDIYDVVTIAGVKLSDLRFDRCRLGRYLRVGAVRLSRLDLRDCAAESMELGNVVVAEGSSITGLYGADVKLRSCRFESWSDLHTCCALDANYCTFTGPTRVRWSPAEGLFRELEPNEPRRPIPLDGITVPLESACDLTLEYARFESAAHVQWGGAEVRLPGTLFGAASTLDRAEGATGDPRLTDVAETDAALLRAERVDLTGCDLAPAASLGPIQPDRLAGPRGAEGRTLRRHVADERDFPAAGSTEAQKRAQAATLSRTYRDLRRAAEAAGNFASANDLYYGERRWLRTALTPRDVGWWWLAAYGAVGYGVRPWRPFAMLVVLLLVAVATYGAVGGLKLEVHVSATPDALIDDVCGKRTEPNLLKDRQRVFCPAKLGERVEFTVRSTTALIRPVAGYQLSGAASVVDVLVRLLAALFFGLFLLAMRNRVHR